MARKQQTSPTTAQRLSSIVKSCRDIMRKDKGLNGDLDRLPMLTWITGVFRDVVDYRDKVPGNRRLFRNST
jgi:type I restriction enzyme M protein